MNGWLPIAVAGLIAGPNVEANDERGGRETDFGESAARCPAAPRCRPPESRPSVNAFVLPR